MMHPRVTVSRTPIARRRFLRGVGASALALPLLEAMGPSLGRRALGQESEAGSEPPKRMVAICASLGFHTPYLFPTTPGTDYEVTPYLKPLKASLDQMTLFSGLSHPEQQGNNGHASELTWLTSAQRPGLAGFHNSISIDQMIAEKIGLQTRFPSLVLSTGGGGMSWTRTGVGIPGMQSPAKLFKALFVEGTPKQQQAELQKIRRGQSILDTVGDRAQVLRSELGASDRDKLDQYFSSVRGLEQRLEQSAEWVDRPKPTVEPGTPKDIQDKSEAIARQRLLYDMIVLALQTDSTRCITMKIAGLNSVPNITGVATDWHALSHHGKDPEKIQELTRIELAEFTAFGEFINKLREVKEGDKTLLDSTAVLFGSNLGNASAHDWRNLPVILAGGGYRHGSYVAHDQEENTPFANMFVSLAQRMGVEIDSFGSSTSASLRGLELLGG